MCEASYTVGPQLYQNTLLPFCGTNTFCRKTDSFNSDQHQISPCNTNAYSTPEVMRIKDMIIQGEFFSGLAPVLKGRKASNQQQQQQ